MSEIWGIPSPLQTAIYSKDFTVEVQNTCDRDTDFDCGPSFMP